MKPFVKCPGCAKQVKWSDVNQWRPFCSERCKLIDLGAWASEENTIPGEPANPWEQNEDNNKQE